MLEVSLVDKGLLKMLSEDGMKAKKLLQVRLKLCEPDILIALNTRAGCSGLVLRASQVPSTGP